MPPRAWRRRWCSWSMAARRPFSDSHLPRLMPFEPKHAAGTAPAISGARPATSPTASRAQAAGRARERADDEYRRLLYVGMTRAEDRLIVCGYHGKRAQNPATWHQIVSRALLGAPETVELAHPVTGEAVHRFRTDAGAGRRPPTRSQAPAPAAPFPPLPAFGPLPPDDDLPRPLSPVRRLDPDRGCRASRSSRTARRCSTATTSRASPSQRGLVDAQAAADAARAGAGTSAPARPSAIWNARPPTGRRRSAPRRSAPVAAILDHAGFAPIFAPGSRAEVAVMGELTVSGRKRAGHRQDRPAGGDRQRGADRRLQDQPAGARFARRSAARLCRAACALPRPAAAALSRPAGRRRRCCSPRRRACSRCPPPRWMPRLPDSRRRETKRCLNAAAAHHHISAQLNF